MGVVDIWLRDFFSIYGTIILAIVTIIYVINWQWPRLTSYIYRMHLLGFETECATLAIPFKNRLFEPLNRIHSNDDILKSQNCIRLLEIGFKTGENIPFYPDGTHLISVDWNSKLQEYLRSNSAWQFSHITFEKLIIGDGTSLKGISNECVDAVVSVRSLCSTSEVSKTLREIRRVLVPGGKFFFLEHVPKKKSGFIRWLQDFLTKTKIWPSLFGDCRLNSDPTKAIESAGFRETSWESITINGYVSQQYRLILTQHHIMGIAIK